MPCYRSLSPANRDEKLQVIIAFPLPEQPWWVGSTLGVKVWCDNLTLAWGSVATGGWEVAGWRIRRAAGSAWGTVLVSTSKELDFLLLRLSGNLALSVNFYHLRASGGQSRLTLSDSPTEVRRLEEMREEIKEGGGSLWALPPMGILCTNNAPPPHVSGEWWVLARDHGLCRKLPASPITEYGGSKGQLSVFSLQAASNESGDFLLEG